MKYVKRVVKPSGAVFLYLQKSGLPMVPLKSAEGSPELAAEVAAHIASLTPVPAIPGTMSAALKYYELQSADFAGLADSTKYEYRLIISEFEAAFGERAVASFTPQTIQRMRDLWAKRGHRAANVRLQLLRNVLKPALITNGILTDPFSFIADVRRPASLAEPHIIWPAEVVRTVIEAAIAERRFGLARAVALARYAGARRGDLIKISAKARIGGRLVFRSGKRGIMVDQPEDPELTRWLSATPDRQPLTPWQAAQDKRRGVIRMPPTTLVYNLSGERYTEDGVGLELAKLIGRLVTAQRLDRAAYDFHGLRHTRGVEAALAGCTDAQGAALLGHGSPGSFAQYRRQADRIRMSSDAQGLITALREQSKSEKVETEWKQSGNRNPPTQ